MNVIILDNWGINPNQVIISVEHVFKETFMKGFKIPLKIFENLNFNYSVEYITEFIVYFIIYLMRFKLDFINFKPRFVVFKANKVNEININETFDVIFNVLKYISNKEFDKEKIKKDVIKIFKKSDIDHELIISDIKINQFNVNIHSISPDKPIIYFMFSIYSNIQTYYEKIRYLNKYVISKMLRTKYLYRDLEYSYQLITGNTYNVILKCNFALAYKSDKKKIFTTIFNSLLNVLKEYSLQNPNQKELKKIDKYYLDEDIYKTTTKKFQQNNIFDKDLMKKYPEKMNKSIYLYDKYQENNDVIYISNDILKDIFSNGIYDLIYTFDKNEFLENNFIEELKKIMENFQKKLIKAL
jgi:predicted transcriptional regulator